MGNRPSSRHQTRRATAFAPSVDADKNARPAGRVRPARDHSAETDVARSGRMRRGRQRAQSATPHRRQTPPHVSCTSPTRRRRPRRQYASRDAPPTDKRACPSVQRQLTPFPSLRRRRCAVRTASRRRSRSMVSRHTTPSQTAVADRRAPRAPRAPVEHAIPHNAVARDRRAIAEHSPRTATCPSARVLPAHFKRRLNSQLSDRYRLNVVLFPMPPRGKYSFRESIRGKNLGRGHFWAKCLGSGYFWAYFLKVRA